MHTRWNHFVVMLSALLSISLVGPAWAQRTTATFAGLVVDTSAGALPGADVELTNEGTGIVERQVTSATGEFIFNYVPGGTYTLAISLSGFKPLRTTGISFTAGQNVRRTFQLEVGALEEAITVTGEAPLVNTASPEQRINLNPQEVSTLPTVNRNLYNLLDVGFGVTTTIWGEGTTNTARRLRLNGLGGQATSITANGTDASGNAGARQISQFNNISKIDIVSIEAVGEVNIVKGVVPAEYGMAMAGNLNVITKGGTNRWTGSLFHRYEGDALSSKPFLLASKPDSTWNQYGGSWGGPIRRDHAFFFAAFEGYRLDSAHALTANVPTQRFRDLALTALPFPETRLFLDQYPLPNQSVTADALLGVFTGPGASENGDEHVDLRTDVHFAGGNLSGTFTGGHPSLSRDLILPDKPRVYESLNRRMSASYSFVRGRWSSETRFGYNYNYIRRHDAFWFVTDPAFPPPANRYDHRGLSRIGFPGLTTFQGEQHIRGQIPTYSFEQQITRVTDRHAIKFGAIYSPFRGGRWDTEASTLTFQTLADLLANRPQIAVNFLEPESIWFQQNYGVFVQDDWRVNPKLVINAGIRYDYFGRWQLVSKDSVYQAGVPNLDGQPDRDFNFGPFRPLDSIYDDDKGINLGPRLGFAYDVDGGKTIVSGGWGLMFQPYDAQTLESSIAPVPLPGSLTYSVQEAAAKGLRWPFYMKDHAQQLLAQNPPPIAGTLIDPHLQASYAMVYTASLQRALTPTMAIETSYVGTRGYKFTMARTYNEPDRLTGIRPNPNLNQNIYNDNSQRSTYHALQVSLRERRWRSSTFNLNYTLAKNMAHAGGDTARQLSENIASVQDFFDLDSAWGPAVGDVRHLFTGSVIYQVPESRFSSPLARHLIGAWQLSGIVRASTGQPLLITQSSARAASRPDVVDAANAINAGCCSSDNMQYLNVAAFQVVPLSPLTRQTVRAGTVGNGQFRGPGFRSLDASVAKSFAVGGTKRLEFRIDMLNALNLRNYTALQLNINASNFGQVIGMGDARVVQVQARFSF